MATHCGGCSGSLSAGGYFIASIPTDVRRLAFHHGTLHEIDLAFAVQGSGKAELERRLLALQSECGCHAAAVAVLVTLACLAWSALGGKRQWGATDVVAWSIAVAVIAKVVWIAAARLLIVLIARRIARVVARSSAGL